MKRKFLRDQFGKRVSAGANLKAPINLNFATIVESKERTEKATTKVSIGEADHEEWTRTTYCVFEDKGKII